MCSLGKNIPWCKQAFTHTQACIQAYTIWLKVYNICSVGVIYDFLLFLPESCESSLHTPAVPPLGVTLKPYTYTHARPLTLHANKQVCTHSKFNQRGLQLVMLVSVSIRLYRCSGGGLLDLSTIPQQDHKHRHKHTLSAANANLPKCVCMCVPVLVCCLQWCPLQQQLCASYGSCRNMEWMMEVGSLVDLFMEKRILNWIMQWNVTLLLEHSDLCTFLCLRVSHYYSLSEMDAPMDVWMSLAHIILQH